MMLKNVLIRVWYESIWFQHTQTWIMVILVDFTYNWIYFKIKTLFVYYLQNLTRTMTRMKIEKKTEKKLVKLSSSL